MIKPWHRNAALTGLKARLPFRRAVRDHMRRLKPYTPDPENDGYFLENALRMAEVALAHGPAAGRYMEIGAGWTPAMAVIFHAAGFDEIVLCDVERFLDDEGAARARQLAASRADTLSRLTGKPADALRQRIENFRYTYLCPFDLKALSADHASIVVSRAVLEHVPAKELPKLIEGIAHVLKPGGLTLHMIDNSDHYEHGDKSISRVNFLKFSAPVWHALWTLSADSQNRLRHSDYRALFKNTPLEMLLDEGAPDRDALDALKTFRVAAEFAGKTPEDLAVLTSLFLLRKPASRTR